MKISYKWLQSYFDKPLPKPEELAELLTAHSFEVEEIIEQGKGLEGVVVGEILETKKHPDADKLNVAQVDVGEKKPRQIVFGQMAEIKVGDKTSVALAPTVLPGNKEIKRAKLRGVLSEGMLCLDQELGLVKTGASITFFPKKVKNGTLSTQALGLEDTIFEIDVSPNRSHDCLGHLGVAKEVGTILKLKVESVKLKSKVKNQKSGKKVYLEIKDKNLCNRSIKRVIENIEVKESPDWLKARLISIGQKPINNIVDITNYVMFDLGQPVHTFDFDKVAELGGRTAKSKRWNDRQAHIVIKTANEGEKITTLDGKEYKLDKEVLVISDGKKALDIAGIMGGVESAITEETKNLILSASNFDQISVRKTSRRLGIRTDASSRFEQGLSPELAEKAMDRMTDLILEIASTKKTKVGGKTDVYFDKQKPAKIRLFRGDVEKLLGIEISGKEILEILARLGFQIKQEKKGESFLVVAPLERLDIENKGDLIEEVARIYGYNNIPLVLPTSLIIPPEVNENYFYCDIIRNILIGTGFSEVYNYSFANKGDVEVANPIAKDKKFLRKSLVDGLHTNLKENLKYFDEVKIFEIGKVFFETEEITFLAGVLVNKKNKDKNILFYEAKGVIETLLNKTGITDFYFNEGSGGGVASIMVGNTEVGTIHCEYLVSGWEINLEVLIRIIEEEVEYRPISKYPAVKRDLAIFVPAKTKVIDVLDVIENSAGGLLVDTDLFDIYNTEDKKSFAFHLIFQSHDKTFSESEINEIMGKVIKRLESKSDWEVRKQGK
jgi:phenylalanyl-tRNA synthetase beta chain